MGQWCRRIKLEYSSTGTATTTTWNSPSNDDAIFDGTAATVTMNGGGTPPGIQANSVTFLVSGYTINGLATAGWLRLTSGIVTNNTGTTTMAVLTTNNAATGNFTKWGAGTLVFTGAGTGTGAGGGLRHNGNTTVNGGALQLQTTGTYTLGGTGSGNITIASGATMDFYNTGSSIITVPGVISGLGAVRRNTPSAAGADVVFNGSNNNYSGGTQIRGGFIGAGTDTALGTGLITIGTDPNPLGLFAQTASHTVTNAIIFEAGNAATTNLTLKGTQNLTLSGPMTLNDTALASQITITGSGNPTLSGAINGASGKSLVITNSSTGVLTISASNGFSGGLQHRAGRINYNNNFAAGTNTITVGSAATDISTSAGNILITNAISLASGANTRVFANSGTSLELKGKISGSGALFRDDTGAGPLIISGTNNFSGGFTVSSRVLFLGNKNALGTGTFTIGSGVMPNGIVLNGTNVALTGVNAITNAVTVNTNFFVGANSTALEFSGPIALGAVTRNITNNNSAGVTISGKITSTGAGLTKAGSGSLTLSGSNTYSGVTTVNAGILQVANASGSATRYKRSRG